MPVNTNHALVLDGSGNHYFTCGQNGYGQLGTGDKDHREIFTQVNLPEKFISLSAGSDHSLGISESDGAMWSWGSNSDGQLGQGTKIGILLKPTKIPNTRSFVQVSCGLAFSLALDSNGHVWSFGNYYEGCLGLGCRNGCQYTPRRIEELSEIKSISAGTLHGIALARSGIVLSFGSNDYGQLGLGHKISKSWPNKIEGLPEIVQISAGFYHTLVLDTFGCVWSFGNNELGQLGLSDITNRIIPRKIPGLSDVLLILASGDSSVLKNSVQHVFVFGSNQYSLLGFGAEEEDIRTPIVQELWTGKIVIPGGRHNVILDEEGYLSFFGWCPNFVQQGKHEGVQVGLRNVVPPTKSARK